ncbi:hypothetical protein F5B19DRAFT_296271 [Rostrohypoxylon terebratum]|nr:hypothetical protein F5B19DRAFT_296271 [Rostrohypoxylon terebratum]
MHLQGYHFYTLLHLRAPIIYPSFAHRTSYYLDIFVPAFTVSYKISEFADYMDDPYLQHLASKNKFEYWMHCLTGEPMDDSSNNLIHILYIESSGCFDKWKVRRLDEDRLYLTRQVGAMYDINPEFFRALLMNCGYDNLYGNTKHHVPGFLAGDRPRYLDMGYGWASVIIPHYKNNCNIVLVSASLLRNPTIATPYNNSDHIDLLRRYSEALLKRDVHFFVEAHKDPLRLLLPALDIHATYLYRGLVYADQCLREGIQKRQEKPDLVENAWSLLRMMRHDGMGPFSCIQQYDNDHNDGKVQHSAEFNDLARRFRCIAGQISLTEALARDYLQHHVGLFSLEESRASIKQSKVALEEGRGTKLVTVLAIFFVPISLSTSIFGMNINELNDSGQSLWVFIVSTVVILAVTMMIWGFMYQFQKYNSLPRLGRREWEPWHTKLSCLLQLIFRGHIIWAWKSGFFFPSLPMAE